MNRPCVDSPDITTCSSKPSPLKSTNVIFLGMDSGVSVVNFSNPTPEDVRSRILMLPLIVLEFPSAVPGVGKNIEYTPSISWSPTVTLSHENKSWLPTLPQADPLFHIILCPEFDLEAKSISPSPSKSASMKLDLNPVNLNRFSTITPLFQNSSIPSALQVETTAVVSLCNDENSPMVKSVKATRLLELFLYIDLFVMLLNEDVELTQGKTENTPLE